MLLAGDELGRSQQGNNNAYCQDNELSWIDWRAADAGLTDFTERLFALRRRHPALRRLKWFDGSPSVVGERDIAWLWRDGTEMTREQWEDAGNRCFGFRLGRDSTRETGLLVLLNAGELAVDFTLPAAPGGAWVLELDTARAGGLPARPLHHGAEAISVPPRALLLLASTPEAA